MAQKKTNQKAASQPAAAPRVAAKSLSNPENNTPQWSVFEVLERHLESWRTAYIFAILALATLCSLLLFDVKISTANDDSVYIEAAFNYTKNFFGYFYSGNAPLYPLILWLPVQFMGINVVFLKAMSIPFFVVSIWILYKAFAGRVPYLLLFFALFATATNCLYAQHASLTYTECFFSMVQALFFYLFFRFEDQLNASENTTLKAHWRGWLLLGFSLMLLFISRSISAVAISAVVLYFFLQKNWLFAAYSVASLAICTVGFEVSKRLIWGAAATQGQFNSQGSMMFQKDAYDPNKGQETLWGFVERFYTNAEIYLSSRLWQVLGFKSDTDVSNSAGLTIFTIAVILSGLVVAIWKPNRAIVLGTLYFGALSGATYIGIHTSWGQARLVMIFLPFILMASSYGFYELLRSKSLGGLQFVFLLALCIFAGVNFNQTWKNIIKHAPVLGENMRGDKYYGYTPDWTNYLKMSEWCGKNIPDSSVVAGRKAAMSFIYSNGRKFYPITNVIAKDADSLVNILKEGKVSYVILAELRTNPNMYVENMYINTIHRFLSPIQAKYPDAFEVVHQEGTLEKAKLLKINYDKIQAYSAPAIQKN